MIISKETLLLYQNQKKKPNPSFFPFSYYNRSFFIFIYLSYSIDDYKDYKNIKFIF